MFSRLVLNGLEPLCLLLTHFIFFYGDIYIVSTCGRKQIMVGHQTFSVVFILILADIMSYHNVVLTVSDIKITSLVKIYNMFLLMSDHMCVIFVQTLAVLYYFCLLIVNWLTI